MRTGCASGAARCCRYDRSRTAPRAAPAESPIREAQRGRGSAAVDGARLQQFRRHPRRRPLRRGPPPGARRRAHRVDRVRDAGAGRRRTRRGRHRSGGARRRGAADRRHGARAPVQVRDHRLPAGRRAHRPPPGRLARQLVARRCGHQHPDRPGRERPGRRGAAAAPPQRHPGRPLTVRPRAAHPVPSESSVPAVPTWPHVLSALMAGQDVTGADTAWAMGEIMAGDATPAQLAAFAVLLRAKGETPDELAGLVATMVERATPLTVPGRSVDVVGTGADRAHTVNISTMAALVVAGTGRQVVKHGNRAASSSCGSADVLEELGVVIDLPPAGVAQTVAEVGIGFCFAPVFHSGMRHAGAPRRELGVPTFFNFLGPLTNPGRVAAAAIGCADPAMAPVMAAVLADRGDTALVFRGDDGLDELTTTTTSSVWAAAEGSVVAGSVDPAQLGIDAVPPEALRGGDRAVNAGVVREVLAGRGGGARDAALLNAAAAIAAYDGLTVDDVTGEALTATLRRALAVAVEAVDSGAAADLLERWIAASRSADSAAR